MRTRLLLVVLALVVAGVAVGEEGVATTGVDTAAVQPPADGTPGIAVEPVEAERALVVDGEIETRAATCMYCPTIEWDECSSPAWHGLTCSDPSIGCRCLYCDGFLGCVQG